MDKIDAAVVIVLLIIFLGVSLVLHGVIYFAWRRECIARGVAHYHPTTGAFTWDYEREPAAEKAK